MGARKPLWILLALACALYFIALGNSAIWDANEAFYVETPREMLQAHDLINPSFNYLPRFNKPVLSYWLVAGLYKLLGVSVAVERLGIALGAMIIIAAAYCLARAASPDRSRQAALWAAAGLAANPRLLMFARRIFIDIWVSAFLALTLLCFALAERYPERRRRFLVMMYLSAGLGALTKGPIAIALPAFAFGLYLLVRREVRRLSEMMLPPGIAIVLLVVAPWYAVLYAQHGWTYITSFFIGENLERYTSGLGVLQHRGPWFYLPVVLTDSFPLSGFLMVAAAGWKERTKIETLLWCWIVAIVGFFSLSAGKQDLYIFPIVPAVAALAGLALDRDVRQPRWCRWLSWTVGVTGGLVALAGAAVVAIFAGAGRVYALESAMAIGVVAMVGGVCAAGVALARRPRVAYVVLLASVVAIDAMFVLRVLPEFERYKPVPAFSRTLQARLQPGDDVVHYQLALPSMSFYLQRHVETYFDERPFVEAMQSGRRVYAVLSDENYRELEPRIGSRTCIIDRRPTFDVKLKSVLERQPLPELLLVTNRCQ